MHETDLGQAKASNQAPATRSCLELRCWHSFFYVSVEIWVKFARLWMIVDVMHFWRSCQLVLSVIPPEHAKHFSAHTTFNCLRTYLQFWLRLLPMHCNGLLVCFFVVYVSSLVFSILLYTHSWFQLTFFCNSVAPSNASFFLLTLFSALTLADCEN